MQMTYRTERDNGKRNKKLIEQSEQPSSAPIPIILLGGEGKVMMVILCSVTLGKNAVETSVNNWHNSSLVLLQKC